MRMSSSVRGSGQGSVEATVVLQCAEDGESTLSIRVGQPDMVWCPWEELQWSCENPGLTACGLSICDTTDRTGLPSKAAAVVSSRYKERKEPDQALCWFTANRKTKPHSRDGKP